MLRIIEAMQPHEEADLGACRQSRTSHAMSGVVSLSDQDYWEEKTARPALVEARDSGGAPETGRKYLEANRMHHCPVGPTLKSRLWGTTRAVNRGYARAAVEQSLAAKVCLCKAALCVYIIVANGGCLRRSRVSPCLPVVP